MPPSSPSPNGGGEGKLVVAVIGVYSTFLLWGYLQERITGVDYINGDEKERWKFPFFLNACMAMSAASVGGVILALSNLGTPEKERFAPPFRPFLRPALACTLASPLGYAALRHLSFPLLVLCKSCKLVPVMLMGYVLRGKTYTRAECSAVALVTIGVTLFSMKSMKDKAVDGPADTDSYVRQYIGIGLVTLNLLLDGVTNAEQDALNKQFPKLSSWQMMYLVNVWMVLLHIGLLLAGFALQGSSSELMLGLSFIQRFPDILPAIGAFVLCAALGQACLFTIIHGYGSLVSVTVTITRKFFSILLSVYLFGHAVEWWQWVGMVMVFLGLCQSIVTKYSGGASKLEAKQA
ncbi:unnamed protein product [Chrysoparadoxa australica]